MHRKNHRGLWITYYCPRKNRKDRLRVDAVDCCPICGKRVEWTEPEKVRDRA